MPTKKKKTEIELILLPIKNPPKKLDLLCIRCDEKLECDHRGGFNAAESPSVYGGVVFRSSGQFGSTVLDSGVGIPRGYNDEVQIILCDECIKKLGDRINMWTEPRDVVIEYTDKYNKGTQRVTKWADYVTFNDVERAAKKANPYTGKQPLGEAAKWEALEKAGLGQEAKKRRDQFYSMIREIGKYTHLDGKEQVKAEAEADIKALEEALLGAQERLKASTLPQTGQPE